ncbi:MAG: substrate-binding domain-containing protein [Bacteroidales bacterium]|jgi:phosphate transport system substrate-binding protein|nr:substrate-binding domain-containing protein [Bacteroidales bacterium]
MKKILIFILLLACILFVGFWALLITAFSGNGALAILTFASVIALLILTFLTVFSLQKMKRFLKIAWITFPSLALVLGCTFYKIHQDKMYDYEIPRVSESDFDLSEYQPFTDGTKAAFLNEKSALTLTGNLPLLDGATALYPLYSAFVQAVYPEKEYLLDWAYAHYSSDSNWIAPDSSEVHCSNTTVAYRNIADGNADIIFVAEPSKEQLEYAKKKNVELKKTVIGKEAFVFFVNAQNPVDNLTVEQIQDIYSGNITNWKEVGGNDEEIRAFQRNEGSGSQTAFLSFMKGKKIIEPIEENRPGGMGGIVRMVSDYGNYGNSIGFSFKFFVHLMVNSSEIKILKVNGVYPDIRTIKNGQYPISGDFYAVTNAKNTNENVAKLLDWILSEQGQYLVEKTGYCPVE